MASYLASTAPQVQKKCAQPACGDPATHHLKTFLHGRTRVTLSVTVVPAAQALPDADRGQIWVWARPLVGDTVPNPAVRRVRLSQDAGCLSFGETAYPGSRLCVCHSNAAIEPLHLVSGRVHAVIMRTLTAWNDLSAVYRALASHSI